MISKHEWLTYYEIVEFFLKGMSEDLTERDILINGYRMYNCLKSLKECMVLNTVFYFEH